MTEADAIQGQRMRLQVGAVAHGGHCVARHEGRAVFVRHTLPGEVVDAVVTEGAPTDRFWRADAVTIVEASPDRVPSAWPEAGPGGVGGGELAHVALPAQRAWKAAVLREAFERFATVEFPGEVAVAPGDDERGGLGYRTRVSAVAGDDGRATMRVPRSLRARTLEAMPLATRHVEGALLAARLQPGTRFSVAAAGDSEPVVVRDGSGAPRLTETVATASGEISFTVRANGFWQVHREAPALLVREVERRVEGAKAVVDLYAGAGLLGISLAAAGAQVTMVESDRKATADAALTVERLGLGSRVLAGDVRRTVASGTLGRPDVVVLDPPRSGAGAATLDAIVALKAPRIVYVACDPVALARDVALLALRGYQLEEAQAFDLFPMTHHVETIASFSKV